MDSRQLIDAQFNRAVEIVQGLPKTGPIQTGYEEKLTMYSLYKQATIGNVTTSRPGIFDMLGRAKWDAWYKHRDLDQYEAKWLYVDALLKTLSKYSDKTTAKDLIDELRSFGGDSANLVSSYTLTRAGSRGSSSSTSTVSEDNPIPLPHGPHDLHHPLVDRRSGPNGDESSDDGEAGDESRDLPVTSQPRRPLSSVSFSSRYKTPLIGSLPLSPPPARRTSVPPMQPLPNFEAPSAFADTQTVTCVATSSAYASLPPNAALSSSRDALPHAHSVDFPYRNFPMTSRYSGSRTRPPSRTVPIPLEHAMENMQAHLAALTERVDTLESSLASCPQPQAQTSLSSRSSGRGSPADSRSVTHVFEWDIDDMGLWSLVLKPLLHNLSFLRRLLLFFLTGGHDKSPILVVVRRLCLDLSFIMAMLGVLRAVWVKTGTRRREVAAALIVLWGALTGRKLPRARILRL